MLPIILAAQLAGAVSTTAAMQTDVGILTCTLAEHAEKDTAPDSQTKLMHCAFKPAGNGPGEVYIGEVKRVGSQTALSGKRVLIWSVLGPSDRKLAPAILQQTYVGRVAGASGEPETAKLLVGERDDAYSLQPIADEEHKENAEPSVTVVELRIKSTPG
ncbi:DUF992 domain-containing protein [Hyphomicrobium sp. 1Nfss2.1]|uniref:DUF992 domain-containing protein n=1 Tax=Hyphomicrobium sp. 1Nfss2.1 TaxID=3413936 RepID=UPI003C7E27D9